jgi:hypothetical protein
MHFPITPTRATCPAHLIRLDLITLILFGEKLSYEAPYYAVFSRFPQLPTSYVQMKENCQ